MTELNPVTSFVLDSQQKAMSLDFAFLRPTSELLGGENALQSLPDSAHQKAELNFIVKRKPSSII